MNHASASVNRWARRLASAAMPLSIALAVGAPGAASAAAVCAEMAPPTGAEASSPSFAPAAFDCQDGTRADLGRSDPATAQNRYAAAQSFGGVEITAGDLPGGEIEVRVSTSSDGAAWQLRGQGTLRKSASTTTKEYRFDPVTASHLRVEFERDSRYSTGNIFIHEIKLVPAGAPLQLHPALDLRIAEDFERDVGRNAGSEEVMVKFRWDGRKRYPEYSGTQKCWHVQSVERLVDRDGRAHFLFASSNKHGGLLHVGRTYDGINNPSTGHIQGIEGRDGNIVWHWSMQLDDAGSKLPGTGQEVGRWNHPSTMDTLGSLVAVAMQDTNLEGKLGGEPGDPTNCEGRTGESGKVVWLSFANPEQPRKMATWTGAQMHLSGGNSPDIVRVAALSVPVRGAPESRAVLISASGGKGNTFGIAINPEEPTRVDAYQWSGGDEIPNVARVTEWYYGRRFAGGDLRVFEVHDWGNHGFKHTALLFIDRDGSTHELPGPNTINFKRGRGTRTVETFESDQATPGRASGIYVGESGRASILGGKVNNNERAHVWIRQRR